MHGAAAGTVPTTGHDFFDAASVKESCPERTDLATKCDQCLRQAGAASGIPGDAGGRGEESTASDWSAAWPGGSTFAPVIVPDSRLITFRKDDSMQKRLFTAALIALFVPAAAIAQKVSYDYDKTATFASYKTYAHKDGTNVGQPLIDERIVAALDAELAAKGLTRRVGPRFLRGLSRRVRQAEGHLDL